MLLVIATIYVSLAQSYTWKSGWLPALIGLLATVWIGAPRLRLPVIVASLMIVWLNFRGAESYLTGSEGYSISTRVEAWRIIWEIVKVNPVLGLGFANYYFYTPLFPILGYYVQFNSHNNYVDIIAQTGFAGLICFLWFIGELGVSGWRLKEEVSEGFAKAYIIGALGGLVGTLVAGMLGDWFLPFVYNVGLNGFRSSVLGWLFLGGIVAIEQMVHRSMGQPEN
jgi:O-antigen ligase